MRVREFYAYAAAANQRRQMTFKYETPSDIGNLRDIYVEAPDESLLQPRK